MSVTVSSRVAAPAPPELAGTTPLLEVRDVSKSFGSVIALKDISMSVHAGEVMCLLGDNGAGKSTLIKILSGVHPASEGEYLVEGKPVRFGSPATRSTTASPPSTRTWR